jgi:hypothetical protein
MKKSKMKATTLRTTLSFIIIIVIGLSALGFYYIQGKLNTYAVSVGQAVSESTAGGTNTGTIKNIQEEIAEVQAASTKADSITVSSLDYQTQIIKDLNKYASNTGISITDYSFTQATSTATKVQTIPGVGINSITITLGNPIPFDNLIQFLKSIENNLPKMQINGINISHDQTSADAVTIDPLTIEVYTR